MNLAGIAIERSRFTFVVYVCLVFIGIASFQAIPKQEDPDVRVPNYTVVVTYPGANAAEIEQSVARPVEEAMKELEEVKRMTSSVRDGYVMTKVEFYHGVDVEKKYEEMIRQSGVVLPRLPEGIGSVEVRRNQTIDVAALQIALVSSEAGYGRLQDCAEALSRRLQAVSGVRRVRKHAYPEKQVNVSLDMVQLAALGISADQIAEDIRSNNRNFSAGAADAGARRFNIKGSGNLSTIEELRRISLGGLDGADLKLGDIAQVEWGTEEVGTYGRYNGEQAMFVSVLPQADQNLFHLSDGVRDAMRQFETSMPADIRLEVGWDQSESVQHRMAQLRKDFILALVLVALTVIPLGVRSSLLVMVSIPLSLSIGVIGLFLSDISINQLSIVGAVIALGLLVDDSIVVVENVTRYRREGRDAMTAAIEATRQITPAVISTTLTLLFAFLPLLMLPGTAGEFIRSLALSVIYTVLASMVVSLTIVPVLSRYFYANDKPEKANRVLRTLEWIISASYRPLLQFCMKYRALTLVLALLLIGGGAALVPRVGVSLFPKADLPQFLVQIETEEGASIAATGETVDRVEAILAEYPQVTRRFVTVGDGNPQIYYNARPGSAKANTAEIFATLSPYDPVDSPALLAEIRARLHAIPGTRIVVKEFENGGASDSPVEVRLFSEDLEELSAMAAAVEDMLTKLQGTDSVKNPLRVHRTDLRVVVNQAQAKALGVRGKDIDMAARLAFAGVDAGSFRDHDGYDHPICLLLPRAERATLQNWPALQVRSHTTGAYFPINQVAELEMESTPPLIERYNQERSISVSSLVSGGYNVARVTAEAKEKLEKMLWPPGMRWELGGEEEERNETFGGLGIAVLVAAFGILAILVLQFGSFRGTAIVASVIPLGFIGGFAALWLTGYTLSFTAGVGFIALIGIEIKNSILLVDFTNELRAHGLPLQEAIEKAGEIRFLPVVLTTLTALGALLPLALQHSGLYSPLATVIIGGLLSSLLLSRIVTPVLYSLIPPPRHPVG